MKQIWMDPYRKAAAERLGTEPGAIFIACTHTHLGPKTGTGEDIEYLQWLEKKICDAVILADRDLAPVTKMLYTRGIVKEVSFIRRYRMKDGSIKTNPGWQNPEIVGPVGENDERSSLLVLKRENAPEIAIINFQVHPDVIGGKTISADYPHFVRDTYESIIPNSRCVYFNGCQGDTNHCDFMGISKPQKLGGYDRSEYMGNYFKTHGLEEETKVYREHLKRVLEISGKYFKEPMIWSDMIHDTPDGKVYSAEQTPSPEQIARTPKNVELVFWDYYNQRKEWYSAVLDHHELFPNKLAFGGDIWTWDGLLPNLTYTLKTMKPAMEACLEHRVKTVIITLWVSGQNGADYGQAMAGLPIFSEYCYKGETCTEADIFAAAKHLTGVDEELFHAISDMYSGQIKSAASQAKGFIYGHPLQNLMHYDIDYPATVERFQKALATIEAHTDYAHREFFSILYRIEELEPEIISGLNLHWRGLPSYMSKFR